MSHPTYGLHIPGYSSPSPAQTARFKRLYPDVYADHIAEKHKEHSERCETQRKYEAINVIAKRMGHSWSMEQEERNRIWQAAVTEYEGNQNET
jgi:hypothetical protein